EIARRIGISAQDLGIRTVTLADRTAVPYYLRGVIDEFYLCDELKTQHYLDQDLMLKIARDTGADAIHPGFGFLSETAEFATSCIKAGLVWIGPNPDSMTAMASKHNARAVAEKVG